MIKIQNLQISFPSENGKTNVLKSISFEIPKGKTIGIVGESGSGKSVTALTIMRLLSQKANIEGGEIWYESNTQGKVNLLTLAPNEMRKLRGKEIAMIFQEPMTSLNPVFSCGFQVAEALQLHLGLDKKKAKEKTLELFQKVELPEPERIFESYPHEISGGQKQRVMIAMAISCEPALLIADEPTTALDVTVQKSVLDLLRKLQQETGMSMMFITHDLGVVAEIAEEVVVMYKGEIQEIGKTTEIFRNPQNPYTKGLLACRPRMDLKVNRLPTVEDFLKGTPPSSSPAPTTSISDESLLKVENLKTYFPIASGFFRRTKSYKKAVENISFEVKAGETLGLVGESGCGKTTLGRTILRLVEPTEGNIIFRNQSLRELSDSEMRKLRKQMQIIFQDPYSSLNPRMRIGDAILEAMQVHNLHENTAKRKEKVKEWLSKVGLSADDYNKYPHEFSGGQRQRVCIARALAVEPKFIICDESVSALDVSVQAQILNLLKDLQAEFQLTYIFISHDLSVVKFMSDRIMVMREGKMVELAEADTIYNSPTSDYTKALLAAVPKGL